MVLTMVIQLYFPDGLGASDILPRLGKMDVVVAGGLHKEIKGALLFPLYSFALY